MSVVQNDNIHREKRLCYNQKMISLRSATPIDVSTLQSLNDEVFIDNSKYDSDLDINWAKGPEGFSYFTQLVQNQKAFCIIAEENDVPIGYIAASLHPIPYRKSKYIELENMGIVPSHRSKGIGSMLMDELYVWAKSQGFDKILVNAYVANIGAVAFYKKNGFSEIDVTLEKSIQ